MGEVFVASVLFVAIARAVLFMPSAKAGLTALAFIVTTGLELLLDGAVVSSAAPRDESRE